MGCMALRAGEQGLSQGRGRDWRVPGLVGAVRAVGQCVHRFCCCWYTLTSGAPIWRAVSCLSPETYPLAPSGPWCTLTSASTWGPEASEGQEGSRVSRVVGNEEPQTLEGTLPKSLDPQRSGPQPPFGAICSRFTPQSGPQCGTDCAKPTETSKDRTKSLQTLISNSSDYPQACGTTSRG